MKLVKRRTFMQSSAAALGLSVLFPQLEPGAQEVAAGQAPRAKLSANLEKLLHELEATQARFYNVPRPDGEFLHLLVKVARAKRVLEIGTANGYSAIWLATALAETDGHLTTIEIQPELVRAAKANLERAGLARRVECHEGDAHQVVMTLRGPFDLVFIDAELGGKMDYFRKLYPDKLPRGGIILCHNAITYRSAMQDYLDFIRAHADFDTVILSLTMQDGFVLSYRRRV
jgi:predicted O-methyltransferase YrrM